MICKLWAILTGGRVVYIKDFQGDVYKSIAYTNAFGHLWCRVYWYTATGHCILNEDGTVGSGSGPFYVKEWKYA